MQGGSPEKASPPNTLIFVIMREGPSALSFSNESLNSWLADLLSKQKISSLSQMELYSGLTAHVRSLNLHSVISLSTRAAEMHQRNGLIH